MEKHTTTKKRILVVDDDWATLELLRFSLSAPDIEIRLARNEEEFRRETARLRPDLIVLDIMLGERDGAEIYHQLVREGFDPKIPVVFLSVLAQDISQTPPQPGRTYALVAKPFDPESLKKEIASLLHSND